MKTMIFLKNFWFNVAFLLTSVFFYSCEGKELPLTEKAEMQAKSVKVPFKSSASGQKEYFFSLAAGEKRGYYITVPANYSSVKKYRLVVVFAGTHTTGEEMHNWFGMGWNPKKYSGFESLMDNTIFVYPDQKYQWDGDRGWALGPYGDEYRGIHDIEFPCIIYLDEDQEDPDVYLIIILLLSTPQMGMWFIMRQSSVIRL